MNFPALPRAPTVPGRVALWTGPSPWRSSCPTPQQPRKTSPHWRTARWTVARSHMEQLDRGDSWVGGLYSACFGKMGGSDLVHVGRWSEGSWMIMVDLEDHILNKKTHKNFRSRVCRGGINLDRWIVMDTVVMQLMGCVAVSLACWKLSA